MIVIARGARKIMPFTPALLFVDGLSYGMILFLISSGLTVTLGIMRLLNMAHLGFAMLGGYAALAIMRTFRVELFVALPFAVLAVIILGIALERSIFQWVYRTNPLGQILMTIGLMFVMVASANLMFGSVYYTLPIPESLKGVWHIGGYSISVYRVFVGLVSAVVALLMWCALEFTNFGAKLRAAVENPQMARCVGINVKLLFSQAFAAGCGLAAFGGILGTQMLPLQPFYPTQYIVLALIVVAVGGFGSLAGSLVAAVTYGVFDTFCRYYFPEYGSFAIYILLAAVLIIRPNGLFGGS